MNTLHENNLLTELAHHLKLPDPQAFMDTGALTIGNTVVVVKQPKKMKPDTLWIRIDCGALPGSLCLVVAPRLLQLNCAEGIDAGAVYSALPQDGNSHVFLTVTQSSSAFTDPAHLTQYLCALVTACRADWESMLSDLSNDPLGFVPNTDKHLSCAKQVIRPKENTFRFERHHWDILTKELAAKLGMDQQASTQFLSTGLINASGTRMQLVFNENRSDHFDLCVDLGPVPSTSPEHMAHLGLLANNAVEELDGAIRWGLHPQTRHVIAVIHHSLSTDKARASLPTANDLAELLNCTVKESGSYWEHFNDMSKSKIYKELAAQFS